MSEIGIRTFVLDKSVVPEKVKVIEQDITTLLRLGPVLVTVEVLKHAQDHGRR